MWILMITVVTLNGVGLNTLYFGDEATCKRVGAEVEQSSSTVGIRTVRYKTLCIRDGDYDAD